VIVKILYAILVLSTIAVVGVALAIYWRVRRHLSQETNQQTSEPLERK
jgi:flagellar basal body-associated protein FliL